MSLPEEPREEPRKSIEEGDVKPPAEKEITPEERLEIGKNALLSTYLHDAKRAGEHIYGGGPREQKADVDYAYSRLKRDDSNYPNVLPELNRAMASRDAAEKRWGVNSDEYEMANELVSKLYQTGVDEMGYIMRDAHRAPNDIRGRQEEFKRVASGRLKSLYEDVFSKLSSYLELKAKGKEMVDSRIAPQFFTSHDIENFSKITPEQFPALKDELLKMQKEVEEIVQIAEDIAKKGQIPEDEKEKFFNDLQFKCIELLKLVEKSRKDLVEAGYRRKTGGIVVRGPAL